MIVLVTGDRNWTRRKVLFDTLDAVHKRYGVELVVHGACSSTNEGVNADLLAEQWAKKHEIAYHGFPAQWAADGNSAGPRRNRHMLAWYHPGCGDGGAAIGLGLAFHDTLEWSKGTKDMVELLHAAGVPVLLTRSDGKKGWLSRLRPPLPAEVAR